MKEKFNELVVKAKAKWNALTGRQKIITGAFAFVILVTILL